MDNLPQRRDTFGMYCGLVSVPDSTRYSFIGFPEEPRGRNPGAARPENLLAPVVGQVSFYLPPLICCGGGVLLLLSFVQI